MYMYVYMCIYVYVICYIYIYVHAYVPTRIQIFQPKSLNPTQVSGWGELFWKEPVPLQARSCAFGMCRQGFWCANHGPRNPRNGREKRHQDFHTACTFFKKKHANPSISLVRCVATLMRLVANSCDLYFHHSNTLSVVVQSNTCFCL